MFSFLTSFFFPLLLIGVFFPLTLIQESRVNMCLTNAKFELRSLESFVHNLPISMLFMNSETNPEFLFAI